MAYFLFSMTIVSTGIWGIHILFQTDHLLEKQGVWIENRFGKKWSKPIVHCPICMSSLWGAIGFVSMDYFFGVHMPWKQIFPFMICLCGLNTIISKLTTKERIIVDE